MQVFERHRKLMGDCFERVRKKSVLVAGLGGLGSTTSQLLVRLGFKKLIIVDPKEVDELDLNRQILYDKKDLGRKKVEVAKEKLERISDVEIVALDKKIDENFELPKVDVVVDCLDNFSSRFVLEKKAFEKGIPLVHGGVKGYGGQVTVIYPHKTKTLSEIFGDLEDDPTPPQVFPPTVVLVASIQASEAVKVICGDEDGSLMNRLLVVDLSINSFDTIYLG